MDILSLIIADYISHIQDSGLLPKGDLANQFKPVVPWPHVEGVEVDLNSIRLKNGELFLFQKLSANITSILDSCISVQWLNINIWKDSVVFLPSFFKIYIYTGNRDVCEL